MKQAMQILGYEPEDLNTRKRRDHFRIEAEKDANKSVQTMSQAYQAAMNLNTILPEDVDDALISLRYKHYLQRLMDRVNRVL